MNVRYTKIHGLASSYIFGNKGIARDAVKRLNKAEFYYLVDEILQRTDNVDSEEIIYYLTLKT